MAAASAVTRHPQHLRRWLLVPAAMILSWGIGFAWFVHTAWSTTPPPPRADGIVVLTGGADRVQTGLRLLEQGAAAKLLVSGVGRAAEFPQLAHLAGVDRGLGARVTLGRAAESTHGNASETAEWVAANRVRSLIVVTAGYHMPRALAELRRSLPDVILYPVTVQPPGTRGLAELSAWRLLAGEYTKLLVTAVGLTEWAGRTLALEHG
jgi:uncharacterized SAM-binding protein YcdF (DUF218 family)